MSVKRLQDLEGELLIDHRNSPGVPKELLAASGLPLEAGRGIYEGPIYTCNHCQKGVTVVVAAFGMREKRYVCGSCKKVVCEDCARQKHITGVCQTFESKVDQYLQSIEKGEQPLILLT